ncbi:hypothetical protein [Bacillus sp. T3]|uniref:hypothetical protein n=1 Tax=Bacillus sp. T3 TaxID=467262 RepID=UPI0029815D19|nr:hypothetical protein [Bacillus sp. T3]
MAGEFTEYDYVEAGKIDVKDLPPLDAETSSIMKNEFGTGIKLTIFYYLFVFTIPVLNWFAPDFMFSRMWGGMSYSWFFTSIVSMAMAFIIAFVHTHLYEKRLKVNQSLDTNANNSKDGRSVV